MVPRATVPVRRRGVTGLRPATVARAVHMLQFFSVTVTVTRRARTAVVSEAIVGGDGAAGALGARGRVHDPAEEELQEQRLRVALRGVAHGRVPGAAAVVVVPPGDRVVGAHRVRAGVVGRLVDRREHVHVRPRVRGEVVPLVDPRPLRRQPGRAGAARVADAHDRLLDSRMAEEVRADERSVPRPPVLGVRRGVHAHEAASCLDVALERGLLLVVQDVAGREQEHHRAVLPEVRVREGAAVLGLVDAEAVRRTEVLDGLDRGRDRVVPELGGLREDEDLPAGLGGAGRRAKAEGGKGDGREDPSLRPMPPRPPGGESRRRRSDRRASSCRRAAGSRPRRAAGGA